MSTILKIPPALPSLLTSPEVLVQRLRCLVGQSFILTPGNNKTRTDGSNLRKRVEYVLEETPLPEPAVEGSYKVLIPRAKGVTRIRREWLDTFIVTTGDTYNLQVWNRNPSEPIPQIEYSDGSYLRANEIRLALIRVDPERQVIRAVVIMTPEYIVKHFGKFGKATIKEQMIISERKRAEILAMRPPILFATDDRNVKRMLCRNPSVHGKSIKNPPDGTCLYPLEYIRDKVAAKLIGRRIEPGATKTRGQQLELMVARELGYDMPDGEALVGGCPDLPHQALEAKIQDRATVDLGRYSPQFEEAMPSCPQFTTHTVRYLIALMDNATSKCVGIILCSGRHLTTHFAYVAERSFKCQRSIPMAFFDRFDGRCVFNPSYP
jgi:hypothetical protein